MVVALMHSAQVSLTRWLPYLPNRGRYAQSKQRRLHRWLNNARINVHKLYKPLIRAALADWQQERLYLSLDTSLFWNRYCLIRIAVVHRGRALPVAWRVMAHSSSAVSFDDYQAVLQQAVGCMPEGVEVVLLADRGFAHIELLRSLTQRWGWHYRIRLKHNTWVWRACRGWCQLADFHFERGEALCWHNVRILKGHRYGPLHIAFGRNSVNGEFWAVVSDEPTTLQTFADYGLRFSIEESFLDDHSAGWNVHKSEIRSVCALSRLWFILAIATLYLSAQGVQVVADHRRRWVDAHWFRGSSYFRIGWDWIKTALVNGWRFIRDVRFTSNCDPEPAIASRAQHEKRTYTIEFKVSTFCYALE